MGDPLKNTPQTPRSRKSRKWLWVPAVILTVVVFAILLAPVYLSSDGFKHLVQRKIAGSTGGTADIGNLTIGWLKGIRISDFNFHGPDGWANVSIAGIDSQPQLGALLGGALAFGKTTLDKPTIEIDLRKRPAPTAKDAAKESGSSAPTAGLVVLGNLDVNGGRVHLTGSDGKTVEVADLNSQVRLRQLGQASQLEVAMVVADAGQEAKVHAVGTVTPSEEHGWTLKGTSGDLAVEVNDLNLGSLASLFELANLQMQTKGQLSGSIEGTIQDGQMETVDAVVHGQDLDISGDLLNGDRLQTSRLDIDTRLVRKDQTLQVDRLEAHTDWANITATGALPMTAKSMADLLGSESAYGLKGQFDCNLPAVLSQMANTLSLKEGMQITSGRATGTIDTTSQEGRATVNAQAEVTGLAGTIDGKELALSEPVVANLKLVTDSKKTQLETLTVSSAFAKINASGSFEQITYDGTVDLTKFQSELGQFADLGPYQLAGVLASQGQVSIADSNMAAAGSASVANLVLAAADGNSVSEPKADIDFAVSYDAQRQLLNIAHANLDAGFGKLSTADATVPLAVTSPASMKMDVTARDLDLAKIKPFAVLFASFPKDMELAGITQSQLAVTSEQQTYRIVTTDTRIKNLKVVAAGKDPFAQEQVTIKANVQIDPNAQSINVAQLEVDSPQIKIRKGQLQRSRQDASVTVAGNLEGECDWTAVGALASEYMPQGLALTGQRSIAANFSSTYPADDPNSLMAHMNATAKTGIDSAAYKGLNVGATDLDVTIESGVLTIAPFTTTVNEGQLNFAAKADFKDKAPLLHTPGPLVLAKGIQLNKEMTKQMLQYVNPLFANVTGISGVANFECEQLAIPLAAGMTDKTEVVGTFSADNVVLQASGLLDQIIKATGGDLRGQNLTIQPTKINLQDGSLRYDSMQIDIGDNPLTFGGRVGLNGKLDMTVTLPWTLQGRTARVGREDKAGQRIEVALGGTLARPELDVKKLFQDQLLKGLEGLLNR